MSKVILKRWINGEEVEMEMDVDQFNYENLINSMKAGRGIDLIVSSDRKSITVAGKMASVTSPGLMSAEDKAILASMQSGLALATQKKSGLMSYSDKTKLDDLLYVKAAGEGLTLSEDGTLVITLDDNAVIQAIQAKDATQDRQIKELQDTKWGEYYEELPTDIDDIIQNMPVGATIGTKKREGVNFLYPDEETIGIGEKGEMKCLYPMFNKEEWITESGEWVSPIDGICEVLLIGGGRGGLINGGSKDRSIASLVRSGSSGYYRKILCKVSKGQVIPVIIGAGGTHQMNPGNTQWAGTTWYGDTWGGDTHFGEYDSSDSGAFLSFNQYQYLPNNPYAGTVAGAGFGGREDTPTFYGAGGGCSGPFINPVDSEGNVYYCYDGADGAIRIRYNLPE